MGPEGRIGAPVSNGGCPTCHAEHGDFVGRIAAGRRPLANGAEDHPFGDGPRTDDWPARLGVLGDRVSRRKGTLAVGVGLRSLPDLPGGEPANRGVRLATHAAGRTDEPADEHADEHAPPLAEIRAAFGWPARRRLDWTESDWTGRRKDRTCPRPRPVFPQCLSVPVQNNAVLSSTRSRKPMHLKAIWHAYRRIRCGY